MKILITQRIGLDKYGETIDFLESNYIKFFNKFHITPILLPNTIANVRDYYFSNKCKKIILTGGEDINPKIYNHKSKSLNKYQYLRDKNEIKLIKLSEKYKIPVLSICRGAQLVNAYFGGKITNNIKNSIYKHNQKKHKLTIIHSDASFFKRKSLVVNSFHNHGIEIQHLSKKLNPIAITNDLRFVEFFHHKNLPIVGIQWHPERKNYSQSFDKKILEAFLNNKFFWKI